MNRNDNAKIYESHVQRFKRGDAYKYSYDNIKYGIQDAYILHKNNRKCKPHHKISVEDVNASVIYWKIRLYMAVLIDEEVKGGYGGTASRPVKRYVQRQGG